MNAPELLPLPPPFSCWCFPLAKPSWKPEGKSAQWMPSLKAASHSRGPVGKSAGKLGGNGNHRTWQNLYRELQCWPPVLLAISLCGRHETSFCQFTCVKIETLFFCNYISLLCGATILIGDRHFISSQFMVSSANSGSQHNLIAKTPFPEASRTTA